MVEIERRIEEISILNPVQACLGCDKIIYFQDYIKTKEVKKINQWGTLGSRYPSVIEYLI